MASSLGASFEENETTLRKVMKLRQVGEMYQCHIFPREMLLNKIMASSLGASFEENETTFEES